MTVEDWVAYLNRVDFTGVMQMGAPLDEHLCQAKELHKAAQNCKSEEDLAELMHSNFSKYWGSMANSAEEYRTAAHELWSILQASKSQP